MSECLHLTVAICTRDRAASLAKTLGHLAQNEFDFTRLDVLVVDNGSSDATAEVVRAFTERLPVRYAMEPEPGKCHALNRIIDDERLGDVLAFLDDDMTPSPNWCAGVLALCERWPQHAVFSSTSYVIWPSTEVPGWARRGSIRRWALSTTEYRTERPMRAGEFPSGNHFWVRTRSIGKRRFPRLWAAEPHFVLGLLEDGNLGVVAPHPQCGHRIQQALLDVQTLARRATRFGRDLPHIRLSYPRTVPQARFAQRHPILWRLCCAANVVRWSLIFAWSRLCRGDAAVARGLGARMGVANNLEALRLRPGVRVTS